MSRFLFAAILAVSTLSAGVVEAQQPQGAILGVVVSETGGAPVVGASVAIRRMADSTLVGTVVTSATGAFAREGLPLGTYRIEFSSLGHSPISRPGVVLAAAAPRVDLGRIGMAPAAVAVQGVTAEGTPSAVVLTPDRSIYNVRDMPLAQGGMATDALRAIPEIQVDVDDNITARGGTPQIFLDGRPMPMQGDAQIAFLRSLRADRIDRIEYIPNPSARFEAEGQSGILNIVMRRDVGLGTSGTLSANAGTRGTQNVSTRINHQKGALTLFGGAVVGFNQGTLEYLGFRENLAVTPRTFLQHHFVQTQSGINLASDLTAEWKLSARSTAWSIGRVNLGDAKNHNDGDFTYYDQARAPTSFETRTLDRDLLTEGYSGALGYRRVVQPQRDEFSMELRYNTAFSDNQSDTFLFPHTPDGQPLAQAPALTRLGTDWDNRLLAFQADLARPFGASTRADVGYRANFTESDNDQLAEFLRDESSAPYRELDDDFRYSEDSHAAYVTVTQQVGKLGMQVGARAERVVGEIRSNLVTGMVNPKDSGLFPTVNASYDFGGGRQFRIAYSERIQRPTSVSYNPINTIPVVDFDRNIGNPLLLPAKIHLFTADATWNGSFGALRASPYYTSGSGFWVSNRHLDPVTGVATLMPENLSSAKQLSLSINGSVRQIGPLSGFVNLEIQHLDFSSQPGGTLVSNEITAWFASSNVTALLPGDLRLQVTGGYSPARDRLQGRSSEIKQLNFALNSRVWQNRANATLSVVDPFLFTKQTNTTENPSLNLSERQTSQARRATLTISYNFGRAPQSNRRVVQDAPAGGGDLGQ